MTDPTEAEAREVFDALRDPPSEVDTRAWRAFDYFKAGSEWGRATEREKVRALVEQLAGESLRTYTDRNGQTWCAFCHGLVMVFAVHVAHTADCPWVEARLWLARDEVPDA